MSHTTGAIRPTAATGRRRQWAVNALGLSVLVTYGITYYAVGSAAPHIAREFGLGTEWIFGVFSCALLLNAGVAASAGRLVDRIGGGRALFLGSLGRAGAIVAMALAPEFWSFAAALVAVMLFGQLTEYDAAFAAVVQTQGERARRSISQITLWGGFASTAFWPLSAVLLERMGWREMFLIYAGVMVLVAWPVGWLFQDRSAAKRPADPADPAQAAATAPQYSAPEPAVPLSDAERNQAHWLLVGALSFSAIAMAIPVIFLPILQGLGFAAAALIAATVFGPAQTGARALEFLVSGRWHPLTVAVIATALLPLSLLILAFGEPTVATAVAFALLYGAGNGISYVIRGTVALALFGAQGYGQRLGRIATFRLVVSAAMPLVMALVMERASVQAAVLMCAAAGIAATVCFAILALRYRR
jgi:MFS family permease